MMLQKPLHGVRMSLSWSLFVPRTIRPDTSGLRSKHRPFLALCLLGLLCIATPVFAQPETQVEFVPAQINAANQLVRDGEIQAALDAYSSIENDPAVQSQLDYNRGVALYRNGDIAAAQKLFTEAAGNSDNHLAANASYNLGNCLYSQSLQQMQQPESGTDPAQIIDQLRKAISHYRSSLRSGDSGADARANIELAAELIRQLEQKQEQEKQEKQDQEQQEPEKQDEQQQQDQNQENENQQQQDQSQSEDSSEQQQNQQGEQQQSEQKQGESKQPDSSDQSDSTKPDNGEQGDQANQQPANPEGELKAANEQKQRESQPAKAAIEEDDQARPMTREEAMKMLQAIRDRDMIRRFQQQQRDRSRQVPVEKDW